MLAKWDADEGEHAYQLAFIRSVPGGSGDKVHLTYYDPAIADSVNENNVDSYESLADSSGTDYWLDILE